MYYQSVYNQVVSSNGPNEDLLQTMFYQLSVIHIYVYVYV